MSRLKDLIIDIHKGVNKENSFSSIGIVKDIKVVEEAVVSKPAPKRNADLKLLIPIINILNKIDKGTLGVISNFGTIPNEPVNTIYTPKHIDNSLISKPINYLGSGYLDAYFPYIFNNRAVNGTKGLYVFDVIYTGATISQYYEIKSEDVTKRVEIGGTVLFPPLDIAPDTKRLEVLDFIKVDGNIVDNLDFIVYGKNAVSSIIEYSYNNGEFAYSLNIDLLTGQWVSVRNTKVTVGSYQYSDELNILGTISKGVDIIIKTYKVPEKQTIKIDYIKLDRVTSTIKIPIDSQKDVNISEKTDLPKSFNISTYIQTILKGLKKVDKNIRTLPTVEVKAVYDTVNNYYNTIKTLLNYYIKTVDYTEFYFKQGKKLTPVNTEFYNNYKGEVKTNLIKILNPEKNKNRVERIYKKALREVVRYINNLQKRLTTAPSVINKPVETPEIFKEKEITIELLGDSNKPENRFVYGIKTRPTIGGVVKVPALDSNVTVAKTGNEDFFIIDASIYENTEIAINSNLSAIVKDNKSLFQVDKFSFNQIKAGIGKLEVSNIDNITLNSGGNSLSLIGKDISINGKAGKVDFGVLDGEITELTTIYDNDLKTMETEFNILDKMVKDYCRELNYTNPFNELKIFLYSNGSFIRKEAFNCMRMAVNDTTKPLDFTIFDLDSFYIAFNKSWVIIEKLRRVLRQSIIWEDGNILPKFDIKYNQKLQTLVDSLVNIIGEYHTYFILELLQIRYANNKAGKRNARSNENIDFYFDVLGKNSAELVNKMLPFLQINDYKNKYGKETIKGYYQRNYTGSSTPFSVSISPESGAQIGGNWLLLRYILIRNTLANLREVRENEVINLGTAKYTDSLGQILAELTTSLKGNIKAFIANPAQPPATILEASGADKIFNNKLEDSNSKIENLFIK